MEAKEIIIHHSLTKDSETVSWDAIRRYHIETMGFKDCGYHFGLEKIGNRYEILSGRMMNVVGAHTRNHNHNSIGICFVGNFDKEEVPDPQWQLGIALVYSLCDLLLIPTSKIKGHREYAGYKTCPGKLFDLDLFRHMIDIKMRKR